MMSVELSSMSHAVWGLGPYPRSFLHPNHFCLILCSCQSSHWRTHLCFSHGSQPYAYWNVSQSNDAIWKDFIAPSSVNHFLSCPSSSSSAFKFEDSYSSPFPISLGAICIYWRRLLGQQPLVLAGCERRIKYAQMADGHSLGMACSLWSASSLFDGANLSVQSRPLANIINQHSSRWFELDLSIPQEFYPLSHATDDHAPILKRIHSANLSSFARWDAFPLVRTA